MNNSEGHIVAIFGGGVAGAEAAYQMAQQGIRSVLFEKNALPYGKIEEGLPKWHTKLRDQEESKIDKKLTQPGIEYVPLTGLGHSLSLQEILSWGFSAVLIAVGAWRDRPLTIGGINEFVGKGLEYQNPFVSWFNHKHEPGYSGRKIELPDGSVVIGGGLASLDVMKILMLETTLEALRKRSIDMDLFTLERKGIAEVLSELNLTLNDLGLTGSTLFYRRRIKDMSLTPMPPNLPPEKREKLYQVRERILKNFQTKYLFNVRECYIPVDKLVENDRLSGIVFQETEVKENRLYLVPGSKHTVKSPLFVSSIGSIPEPVGGISEDGELLPLEDEDTGRLEGFENVFALGNAVTGRGNIKESQVHSKLVSREIIENYFDFDPDVIRQNMQPVRKNNEQVAHIADELISKAPLHKDQLSSILDRVRMLQEKAGYHTDYFRWIRQHKPVRLEDLQKENNIAV